MGGKIKYVRHICLDCDKLFDNPRDSFKACPYCGSENIKSTTEVREERSGKIKLI